MLNFDVKRKINTLRDILVGKVPDPKAQVEQITIALIYKFMDDMDLQAAEFGGSREFFKGEYEKYAFSQIMLAEHSAQDRLNLYAEGIEKMTTNPDLPKLFRDILRNAYIPYRDPETLNRFLKEIAEFSYEDSEELGNAFEYLLSIMGSQGDAGQFRTPRHIIDMMVEITAPAKNETILDPACGTAGFLISAYNYIKRANLDEEGKSKLTADNMTRMTKNFAGYDISPDMVRLSRVNMYLHGFTNPNISEYDTLTSLEKWDDNFDVIFSNPPFMTPKGGITPHNRYQVSAKRAEVLFADYIAEHLNPTGRAAIIVPEGIVFQSQTAYKNLRRMLVDDNYLYGVISLPAGVFNPYSGVKTSVLLIDRTLAKGQDSILFVKLNNDGYDLGAQRRPDPKHNEIPDVINIFKDYQKGVDVEGRENIVFARKDEIAEQDYILVGDRFVKETKNASKWPLAKVEEILLPIKYPEKILKSNFESSGKYPIIDQSEAFISGYNSDDSKVVHVSKPVICFGDHTRIMKYVDFDFVLGADGVKILLPNDLVTTKYLYYVLSSVEIKSLGYSRHYKILKDIQIPIPPINVQEEIVAEIEGYQKIIDGARQVVENYKPTIRNDPAWRTARIGDICELQAGGTPSRDIDDYWDPPIYPWYTSGELNDIFTTDPIKYVSQAGYENSSARLFPKGTLLIGMYDTAAFKMSILDRDATFNQAVCGVKPCASVDMLFLLLFFTGNRDTYLKMRVGARQRNLTKQLISDLIIPVPPMEEQLQIVQQVKEELEIINQNKHLIEIFQQKIKDKIAEVWGE